MTDVYATIAACGTLFTAASTVIAQILINRNNNNKKDVENRMHNAEVDRKLDRINERLEEHNHYAKKMDEIEKSMSLMQQDLNYIKEGKFAK